MTDSLASLRRRRLAGLLAAVALLAGLVAYSVLRPDPEEQEIGRLKSIILTEDGTRPDEAARREFREAMRRLNPETRKKLAREVTRDRLERTRDKVKDWTEEQKVAEVDKMVQEVRQNFAKLSLEQRSEIRANFNSEEGRQQLRESLDFYYVEFTAAERKLLDPLVGELLAHLDAL